MSCAYGPRNDLVAAPTHPRRWSKEKKHPHLTFEGEEQLYVPACRLREPERGRKELKPARGENLQPWETKKKNTPT